MFALLGMLAFASLVPAWRVRSRDASRPSIASGRVVDVVRDAGGDTAVIEYEPGPGTRVRFSSGDTEMYRVGDVGDPVLIAYHPQHPREAVVWSIRPLWRALVARTAAGALSLLIACGFAWRAWRGRRAAASGVGA